MNLPSPMTPIAASLSVVGGMVAQVPNTNVGAAGLIASITGLLIAGFQYYRTFMEARNRSDDIRRQAAEIEQLRKDLEGSRERRHEEANRLNALVLNIQHQLEEEKVERARLEGKLGVTDRTHSEAINRNSESIQKVAVALDPPVQVHETHVEPIAIEHEAGSETDG